MPESCAGAEDVIEKDVNNLNRLVRALQDPSVLGHPIDDLEVVETHLSVVLLAGSFAYKLKKPVDLGFVDFTTLEKRRHFCREELRLNRRFAAELYLEVAAIRGSVDHPRLDGDGPPIEYAVKMRRFDGALRFDRLREAGRLLPEHIDDLCDRVAEFHGRAAKASDDGEFGTPDCLMSPVRANFREIDEKCVEAPVLELNGHLRDRAEHEWSRLQDVFLRRKCEGRVRECHGDLHLANIALVDGRALIFDCIEFSPRLRWIDVASEVAFTLMDLDFADCRRLSHRYLSRYLEHTGDYGGLAVLRFYQMYRAMVRAKVAAIRAAQQAAGDVHGGSADAECVDYLWLAERYGETAPGPALVLMHGLSGSGKSTVAANLLERIGAVRVRSDVERKRFVAGDGAGSRQSAPAEELYSAPMTRRTYARLLDIATTCLDCGYSVIVDATFLGAGSRRPFLELAERSGRPAIILETTASRPTLSKRIVRREAADDDVSDANLDVLRGQFVAVEPLSAEERRRTVSVDTDSGVDYARLAKRIRDLF